MCKEAPPQTHQTPEVPLAEWRRKFKLEAWAEDIRAVEKTIRASKSDSDREHMEEKLLWCNLCRVFGFVFALLPPNPVSVVLMSTATFMRWAMFGHHVGHGGYDSVGDARYKRKAFAKGSVVRRCADWLDWMLPEAWDVEHNHLHHYMLGETGDPDLVERNLDTLRTLPWWVPLPVRWAVVLWMACTWKWFYYTPNTLNCLGKVKRENNKDAAFLIPEIEVCTVVDIIPRVLCGDLRLLAGFLGVVVPYAAFLVGPAAALHLAGYPGLAWNVLVNMLLSDVLTNLHSFAVIAPNHTGGDVYRFHTPCAPKSSTFLLRAVIGSVNYPTGGDVNDCMYGWLNYQIEHHMWPDMSMRQYQKAQPLVKAVCEKHGVPYIQQPCMERVRRCVNIMCGTESMKQWERGD